MGNYHGIDWLGKVVIGFAIWQLPKNPRRAYWLFMLANVFSVALAFMATPTIWGNIAGDSAFCLMHMRNLRCLKKQSSTHAATTTPPRSGSTAP